MSARKNEATAATTAKPNESPLSDAAAQADVAQRPCLVFATNGSCEAQAALHFASALAKREELVLRIVTVLEPLPALPGQQIDVGYHMTVEMERGESILDRVRADLSSSTTPPLITCML